MISYSNITPSVTPASTLCAAAQPVPLTSEAPAAAPATAAAGGAAAAGAAAAKAAARPVVPGSEASAEPTAAEGRRQTLGSNRGVVRTAHTESHVLWLWVQTSAGKQPLLRWAHFTSIPRLPGKIWFGEISASKRFPILSQCFNDAFMTISYDVHNEYFISILQNGKQKTHTKCGWIMLIILRETVLSSYPCKPGNKGLYHSVWGFHSKTIIQVASHLHSFFSLLVLSGGTALHSPQHKNSCLRYISGTGRGMHFCFIAAFTVQKWFLITSFYLCCI